MNPVLNGLEVALVAGTLAQGGAERQLFYILKTLCENGARPRLFCLTQGELYESRIRSLGVPITWIGQSGSRPARLLRLISELRQARPALVQSQHFYTNLYVAAAARLLRLPHIGAVRSDVTSEIKTTPLGRWNLQVPRWIAANSQAAVKIAAGLGVPGHRCFFLPNVVDTDRFHPGPSSGNGAFRLIAVGRLTAQKRLEWFLQLASALSQDNFGPLKASVIGDGPLRGNLETEAKRLGLTPAVFEFKGDVEEMPPIYQEADLFVSTSEFEGTPNVVMEAMASGLPVLSTSVGGVPELIEHQRTGFLVEKDDQAGLIAAALKLARDRGLRERLGQQARRFMEEERSCHRLARSLAELYSRVLKDAGRPI